MTTALAHSWYMTRRDLRWVSRQPWVIAITLVQPVIWLLLFGQLFRRVVDIPGFSGGSYIDFLAPGVVIMTALFTSGWLGAGVINDLDRGVLDRFLVSPVRRGALIGGRLAYQTVVTTIQSLIVVALAFAVGARFDGGVAGIAVLVACASLLSAAVGALSVALALLFRQEETLIAAVQFVVLPLTFLSGAVMEQSLMPGWMQGVARFNPVNWAVAASREALSGSVDWSFVLMRGGFLAALAIACAWLATRAFRAYQGSI